MSSADEDIDSPPYAKKRKLQRACDYCRRKKSKCDGPEMLDNCCSNCKARRIECTYKEPHRGNYPNSYVKNLESRLQRMEKLMDKICPDADFSGELDEHASNRGSTSRTLGSTGSRASTSRHEGRSPLNSLPVTPQMPQSPDDGDLSDNDEAEDQGLIESLRKLSISPEQYRYHGKSSGLVLIRTAVELRNQQLGYSGQVEPQERLAYTSPWLNTPSQETMPVFDDFPPDDLLDTLVELFFRKVNDLIPLLHEPMFKNDIKRGLHLREGGFGAVVLLVCACGARYTSDPRVLLDGTDDWRSAGWKWFHAVESRRKLSLAPAQLYDLQICALMGNFLQGTRAPQTGWTVIGSGLRMAVDVGAHRKKMYNTKFTIEDELWRRAFWMLVVMEWLNAYGLGRPIFMHDEDIDVALPTEIDDEYWTSSVTDEPPRQPEGKPSRVSLFVVLIRLTRILASAMRTVYSINGLKPQLSQGDSQWEQRTVTELDSSLNNWLDSLPTHLRWNPNQPDPLFLTQSATLYANYYLTQIAVHRPFMSAARRESPLSLPSVIICTNAARSTLQVLDILYRRTGNPGDKNMGPIFMSGAMLFMHVWGQKRAGRMAKVNKDIEIMRRAVLMLDAIKLESQVSGPLSGLLAELILAVTTPHPNASTAAHHEDTSTSPGNAENGVASPSESMGTTVQQAFSSANDATASSDMSGHAMFGLEHLGYGDSGTLFPSTSGFGVGFGSDQHPAVDNAVQEGDLPMPDFAFMDDTLSMWNSVPEAFGWDDWGAYLSGASHGVNPGHS
ncbi:hypothetical protein L226DRAFT_264291 [Lentinus tigrinus ALCF2SS1-7]|uniref:uncharacterized protein n=1 Tax=Lentinus tigrinus ALCF2SS1-7 TaxID=1328758 RepID=UPI001165F4DC|nr:hypothetical protein L226DRAFT_264291 [Lentinus tigrinus ALCF2SS1-7]